MVLPMIFRGVWLLNNYPYSSNCFQPNRSYRTVVVISILRVLFTDTNMFLSFRSLILILFSLSFMKTNIKLTIHSITLDSWIGSLSASFLIISSKLFSGLLNYYSLSAIQLKKAYALRQSISQGKLKKDFSIQRSFIECLGDCSFLSRNNSID